MREVGVYCYQPLQDKRQQSPHERGGDGEGLDTLTVTPVIVHNIDPYRFPATPADCNVHPTGERGGGRERDRETETETETETEREREEEEKGEILQFIC